MDVMKRATILLSTALTLSVTCFVSAQSTGQVSAPGPGPNQPAPLKTTGLTLDGSYKSSHKIRIQIPKGLELRCTPTAFSGSVTAELQKGSCGSLAR